MWFTCALALLYLLKKTPEMVVTPLNFSISLLAIQSILRPFLLLFPLQLLYLLLPLHPPEAQPDHIPTVW